MKSPIPTPIALEAERDGVHDRLTETDHDQGQHDQTLEDDHPHRPGRSQTVPEHQSEGDRGVDAETGSQSNGIVGNHPHQDAEQAGDQGGPRSHGRGVEPGLAENRGLTKMM